MLLLNLLNINNMFFVFNFQEDCLKFKFIYRILTNFFLKCNVLSKKKKTELTGPCIWQTPSSQKLEIFLLHLT